MIRILNFNSIIIFHWSIQHRRGLDGHLIYKLTKVVYEQDAITVQKGHFNAPYWKMKRIETHLQFCILIKLYV